MDAERKTDLAERLGRSLSLARLIESTLKQSHDYLWSGRTREAFECADRARRLIHRIDEAMDEASPPGGTPREERAVTRP